MGGEPIFMFRLHNATTKIRGLISRIKQRRELGIKENPSAKPFSVGRIEKRMADYARENNIELASKSLYMSDERLSHALRKSKRDAGKTANEDALAEFPQKRYKMKLYYETKSKTFVYHDNVNKYVIHPNYEIRSKEYKGKNVIMITASKLTDINEFRMQKYKEIK